LKADKQAHGMRLSDMKTAADMRRATAKAQSDKAQQSLKTPPSK
jgi:hypothetical protein